MKATEAQLLGFLKKSPQFSIPIYQRTYSWGETECRQLWEDVLRAGQDDQIAAHFTGAIVYIQESLFQVTNPSSLLVIDGQQRLTTVMLLLEALARRLGNSEPVDGFSSKKLRAYYLLNPLEEGMRRFKLLLTQTDRKTLIALLQRKPAPQNASVAIQRAFQFFESRLDALHDDFSALCKGLAKLMVVDISLTRGQDNPQLIFESMNSTGRELSQADLIRNFVLMGLPPKHQTELYEDHWRPIEQAFGQEAYSRYFDSFMRHYLTLKTDEIPKVGDVYAAFKEHSRREGGADDTGVDRLIADVHRHALRYCAMALGHEQDKALAAAFRDLRELKVDVAYPLLLQLYEDYDAGVLTKPDFIAAARLVEAYVFRRAVCGIPTNSLNKTFARFPGALKKERYLESMQAHLLSLKTYRRFPKDDEFLEQIQTRDLYHFQRRSYWLRRMENAGHKELVPVDEYTIEHIMPQNENLSAQWQADLGPDWERVHATLLHTLGNLTLTGYNPEYGDHPFAKKRDMPGGFKQSPLLLNQGIGALEKWDETAIKARARCLAQRACEIWACPALPDEILASYQGADKKKQTAYSLADYPALAEGQALRPVFDALRKEILALDPSVTEEILKVYIAYKAETNFVDVVTGKQTLKLFLQIPYADLVDPRGVAKDVSHVGHHGNGDVQVNLAKLDQVPYAFGLVRQAFERQLGDS